MSFNRNQKRVAGPGFHVNVRYDDTTVLKMKQQSKVHPLLAQGVRLAELYDVKEQELLVTMDHSSGQAAHYFDGYTHCMSAVNGFPNTADLQGGALKEFILNKVNFVGIATTEFVPKPGFQEQGFVSQVGGVVTLINESDSDIHPGDKVKLDINLSYNRKVVREKGIPREKVRFTVARAETSDELLSRAIAEVGVDVQQLQNGGDRQQAQDDLKKEEDAIKQIRAKIQQYERTMASNGDKTPEYLDAEKFKKAEEVKLDFAEKRKLTLVTLCKTGIGSAGNTTKQLKAIIKKMNQLNQRIIGRACSFARQGDRLEVLLQPRNPY